MNKPIAVLSSNFHATISWMEETYGKEIKIINHMQGTVTMKNGKFYTIVNSRDDVLGFEFSDYMIAPDYHEETLLDMVKSRVR